MKVAVTGANGLLGGDAVAQLAPPHQVLAIGRGPCRLAPGHYQYFEADLGDGRSVEAALREFGAEAVLHAGAMTDVDACERDPEQAWRVNVGGTEQVARACRALGARLVAVSTDYVFDGEEGPYREEDVPNARGFYARTKRVGEEAALLLAPDCAVARVAVVYSGRKGAKNTFATQVVEKLLHGEEVKAFSDQFVSPTLAANAAEMTSELLLETSWRGVLHTSGATIVDRVEFAQQVAARFGLSGRILGVKTADVKLLAPRPLRSGLVVEKAAALLAAKPLDLAAQLDRFHAEWLARSAA
ncbi:MAG TPA: SDR family oxidoreductase [Anaeromyxobacteraceae bacterium]|nr:SDR family oxidoreductase [Anaeromyxobacteraceae bacterium]